MLKFINDTKIVSKSPFAAQILLEWANISQLYRMWTEHTAAGQSLWGWISVNMALWLWVNFYRVMLPNDRSAKYATVVGLCMNSLVIMTVIWFRYIVHR